MKRAPSAIALQHVPLSESDPARYAMLVDLMRRLPPDVEVVPRPTFKPPPAPRFTYEYLKPSRSTYLRRARWWLLQSRIEGACPCRDCQASAECSRRYVENMRWAALSLHAGERATWLDLTARAAPTTSARPAPRP